jgi:hypothetical protein
MSGSRVFNVIFLSASLPLVRAVLLHIRGSFHKSTPDRMQSGMMAPGSNISCLHTEDIVEIVLYRENLDAFPVATSNPELCSKSKLAMAVLLWLFDATSAKPALQ